MSSRSPPRVIPMLTSPLPAKVRPTSCRVRAGTRALRLFRRRRSTDLAHGDAVAVGRDEAEPRGAGLELHTGDHRRHVAREAATTTWAIGAEKSLGRDDARRLADRGKARVLRDGHGQQGEPRAAAADDTRFSCVRDLDGARAGGSRCPRGAARRRARGPAPAPRRRSRAGADLVVERRQGQPVVGGLDQHAREDRQRRPLGQQRTANDTASLKTSLFAWNRTVPPRCPWGFRGPARSRWAC